MAAMRSPTTVAIRTQCLLDQVRAANRVETARTVNAYMEWTRRFVRFHDAARQDSLEEKYL